MLAMVAKLFLQGVSFETGYNELAHGHFNTVEKTCFLQSSERKSNLKKEKWW